MRISRIAFTILAGLLVSAVSLKAQVQIDNISTTPVTCGAGNDGTITVEISNGAGLYNYGLQLGITPIASSGPTMNETYTFTDLPRSALYIIIVEEGDPVTNYATAHASVTGPDVLNITSAIATDISCNGLDDGVITVTATGEGGLYDFELIGDGTGTNQSGVFTGLSEGDYQVIVSAQNGCPITKTTGILTIVDPDPVNVFLDNITNVLCFGDLTGSIAVTPQGGTGGYTYAWTGPNGFTSGAQDITSLESGFYSLTVFDANGCSASGGPWEVTQPTQLQALLTGTTNVTCFDGNDGTATMTPSGGVGGYSYSWDGQFSGLISSQQNPTNLVADTYDFTLFDANGCDRTFTSFAVIDEPAEFTIDVVSTTDALCPGSADGTAEINPAGGSPPYTFAWSAASSAYTSVDEDPIAMPADSYNLTITDSEGCSKVFPNLLSIGEPPAIGVSVTGTTPTSCFGGSDGGADIDVSGGTPAYSFFWTGIGTGHTSSMEDPDNLMADEYSLNITDSNGCPQDFISLLTITEPAQINVSIDNLVPVACSGEATGSASISTLGGTPGYTYAWTGPNGFTADTEDISNLEAGNYSLTVTDANDCSRIFTDLVTIATSTSIDAVFIVNDASCSNIPSADGSIDAAVSGGTPGYLFSWSGPFGYMSTDEDIINLVAGDYTLTVTDNLGCIQTFPTQTVGSPPLITTSTTQVDVACNGDATGSIDLETSGGVGPYTFDWSGPGGPAGTTEDISSLIAGAYSVSITDANGCIVPFPDLVTLTEPAAIQLSSSKSDITCNGDADGTIDITVSGGVQPYVFGWSSPSGFSSNSEDIANLEPGAYDLRITDANNCIENYNPVEIITEPAPIVASLVSYEDVDCFGADNGSIEIDVSGGTAPLSFDWTNGSGATVSTSEDPAGLGPGTYTLRVSDASGCFQDYPSLVTIFEPPALTTSLTKTDIACYGETNGNITVSASGGTGPYEYSRNGDLDPSYQGSAVFSSLGAGFYTIYTRDANRCVTSDTISIVEPEEIQILTETKSGQNLCFGDANGSISIDQVIGGVLPYVYSINGGADFFSNNVFNNLPADDYQTVVRDASGCEAFGNLNVITQPSQMIIDFFNQTDITSCSYALEGRIQISGTGGFGSKSYDLNDTLVLMSGDFQNLPAGPYSVGMTDQNGCTLDTNVVILSVPPIVVDNLNLTHITGCSGAANGTATVSGSGGTGTITFAIDGGGFGAGNFSGLSAGLHTITLKDDNDCVLDTTFTLTEPQPIVVLTEDASDVNCHGGSDGRIEITAEGGTAPLSFTLNPGGTSNGTGIFDNLGAGTYTVSVDDAESCGPVDSNPLTINEPVELVINTILEGPISCYGASDGFLRMEVSGGSPPYEYSVNDGASWQPDSAFENLDEGTSVVRVRDSRLCEQHGGSFLFSNPPQMFLSLATTDVSTCPEDSTGSLTATGSGGTGLLEYSLDSMIFGDTNVFNLPKGDYTVYLMDGTGCVISDVASVGGPEYITADISKTDETFFAWGSITISNTSGGTPPYEYSIDGAAGSFSSQTSYTDLTPGQYEVVIRDSRSCEYKETVQILDIEPMDANVIVMNVTCFGADDGSIEFDPVDAEGEVDYSIDGGSSFLSTPLFENLTGPADYYLVAIDDSGKVFIDSVSISEPPEIDINSMVTFAQCNAYSNTGAIEITASGGTGVLNYSWQDGATTEDRSNIGAGSYTLTVTDQNTCTMIENVVVGSLITVSANAGEDTTICQGNSIQLNGQGAYTPAWTPSIYLSDPGILDPMATDVQLSTTYVLTISETSSGFNCYNTDTVTIDIYPNAGLIVTPDTFIVEGTSVPLEASGGPFSAYRWEPATGLDDPLIYNPVAAPVETVYYTVYATNEYGCDEKDSVLVEVIEDLRAYNVFTPNGDGYNDYFDIENGKRFPEIVVEVYSRWGDLLFSSRGYEDSQRWDGRARGKDAPVGTYYYVIIPYNGAKPITGNVTIIR